METCWTQMETCWIQIQMEVYWTQMEESFAKPFSMNLRIVIVTCETWACWTHIEAYWTHLEACATQMEVCWTHMEACWTHMWLCGTQMEESFAKPIPMNLPIVIVTC